MSNREITFDAMIDSAVGADLWSAAALLRFAGEVSHADVESRCTWAVLRAIGKAEQHLRHAIDNGEDVNVVDARVAALRLRLGISGVGDIFTAGAIADGAIDSAESCASQSKAARILESAAKACRDLAIQARTAP